MYSSLRNEVRSCKPVLQCVEIINRKLCCLFPKIRQKPSHPPMRKGNSICFSLITGLGGMMFQMIEFLVQQKEGRFGMFLCCLQVGLTTHLPYNSLLYIWILQVNLYQQTVNMACHSDCGAKSAGAAICLWLAFGFSFVSLGSDYWAEVDTGILASLVFYFFFFY